MRCDRARKKNFWFSSWILNDLLEVMAANYIQITIRKSRCLKYVDAKISQDNPIPITVSY